MKAYTDITQSKILSDILPIESADMRYAPFGDTHPWFMDNTLIETDSIPCWSLAALFGVLPKTIEGHYKTMEYFDDSYHCNYMDEDGESILSTTADTLVDAVYKMVIKLNEK